MPIPSGYTETIVTPKASRDIEAFWAFKSQEAGESLILPDGRCDIIFRYHTSSPDDPIPVITGPATQAYVVQFQPDQTWLGVRLRPDQGYALWRNEIKSAANSVLHGDAAREHLPCLSGIAQRNLTIPILARLVAEITQPLSDDQSGSRLTIAVDALHRSGGRLDIETAARLADCSARHLNRLFVNRIGLSAKTYAQIIQFHRSLRLLVNEDMSISAAAYEGGYADHAHLTRAFQRFGGFAPSRIPAELTIPKLFAT